MVFAAHQHSRSVEQLVVMLDKCVCWGNVHQLAVQLVAPPTSVGLHSSVWEEHAATQEIQCVLANAAPAGIPAWVVSSVSQWAAHCVEATCAQQPSSVQEGYCAVILEQHSVSLSVCLTVLQYSVLLDYTWIVKQAACT